MMYLQAYQDIPGIVDKIFTEKRLTIVSSKRTLERALEAALQTRYKTAVAINHVKFLIMEVTLS